MTPGSSRGHEPFLSRMGAPASPTAPHGTWPSHGLEAVPACPVCASGVRSVLYSDLEDRFGSRAPGSWTLQRCEGCESAYIDPRPTRETIALAYRTYYTHTGADDGPPPSAGARMLRSLRNGYLSHRYGCELKPSSPLGALTIPLFPPAQAETERAVRHMFELSPGRRILDVGCGDGEFLKEMQAAGWAVEGVEPDGKAAAVARRAGISVHEGALAEGMFPANHFDAVTLSHVIEHLHDPAEALRTCRRILRPGGVLWIATPNLESRCHRAFGRHWVALDPPRHLVLYTARSLEELVERLHFGDTAFLPPGPALWGWTFRASAAMAEGHAPMPYPPPVSATAAWKARVGRLRSLADRRLGEELVLVATKPSSGGGATDSVSESAQESEQAVHGDDHLAGDLIQGDRHGVP